LRDAEGRRAGIPDGECLRVGDANGDVAKLMLVGITVICGCTPVPLRETTAGEFVAVLTTLMFPIPLR